MAADALTELMQVHVARIDDDVGRVAQRRQQAALVNDAVQDRPVLGQRMAPPRLGIPQPQHLVVAIEEQHVQGIAGLGPQRRHFLGERNDPEVARPHVDADGEPRARRRALAHQVTHQPERQVVDGLEAHVLHGLQRRREAGARHAGHDDDAACSRHRWPRGHGGLRLGTLTHRIALYRPPPPRRQRATSPRPRPRTAPGRTAAPPRPTADTSPAAATGRFRRQPPDRRPASNAAAVAVDTVTMPSPRTSSRPAIVAGAVIRIATPSRLRMVWSSAIRRPPPSISRSAKSDLPLPEGPRSNTPAPPSATAVAYTNSLDASRRGTRPAVVSVMLR